MSSSVLIAKLEANAKLSEAKMRDLWGNPAQVGPEDDYLLLFKMRDCRACSRMHSAFLKISPPIRVMVAELDSEKALAEAVRQYHLAELPTLIHYQRGNEMRRWGGFFDDELMIAATKLDHILTEAVQSSRDSNA